MTTLNKYLQKIQQNDLNLTEIDLDNSSLNNDDADKLMLALKLFPQTASRIKRISFKNNQLTSINIPAELAALEELNLNSNQLTSVNIPAELILLKYLAIGANKLTSIYISEKLTALERLFLNNNKLPGINIPAELIVLKVLQLSSNQLTCVNIPAELTLLQHLGISGNKLTSIKISETLTALRTLHLSCNQLASIRISEKLIALTELALEDNKLTSINIPEKLISLYYLGLKNNKLTSVNIPAELTSLQYLGISNNQLTSINISEKLISLSFLKLENNQLTRATQIALQLMQQAIVPELEITGLDENVISWQLTVEILQEHFKAMNPVFLSYLKSCEFKNVVINAAIQIRKIRLKCSNDIIIQAIKTLGLDYIKALNKDIEMLRHAFAHNEQTSNVLAKFLSDAYMNDFKNELNVQQTNAVLSLSKEFLSNVDKASKHMHNRGKLIASIKTARQEIAWSRSALFLRSNKFYGGGSSRAFNRMPLRFVASNLV